MKKSFSVLTTLMVCITGFAQGKVSFQNDSLHLVYWGPGFGTYSDQPVNSSGLPPHTPLLGVDLYMGTSSSVLYLYTLTYFGSGLSGPGRWTPMNVQANANPTTGAPFLAGGTTVFVEVQIRDATTTPPPNIFNPLLSGSFYGISQEFTFTLGSGATYPALSGADGNWPVGSFNMDSYSPGARGAIALGIPEPSAITLAALATAATTIVRRKSVDLDPDPRKA